VRKGIPETRQPKSRQVSACGEVPPKAKTKVRDWSRRCAQAPTPTPSTCACNVISDLLVEHGGVEPIVKFDIVRLLRECKIHGVTSDDFDHC